MTSVVRGVVVLLAVFAVINAVTLEEKLSFYEVKSSNLIENAGNLEDLAVKPQKGSRNDDDTATPQEENKGK